MRAHKGAHFFSRTFLLAHSPSAATRTPSSKHTVRRAGSLTLSVAPGDKHTVSHWSQHSQDAAAPREPVF